MKLHQAFAISIALAALVAIDAPAQSRARGQLGDSVEVADGILVRPVAVIEDSRCPRDVRCLWAGRLALRAEIDDRDHARLVTLVLGKPEAVAGGWLTLTAADPAKGAPANPSFSFSYAEAPSTAPQTSG